jgi:hypothetical protein
MDNKATAMKIEKLREAAKDKTLPQEARNQMLDKANMLEQEAAKKAGVKLAKGGAVVAKAPAKKAMAKGGAVAKAPVKKAKK